MKIKQLCVKTLKWSAKRIPIMCFCFIVAVALDYSIIKSTMFILNPVPFEPIVGISVARAAEEKEVPLRLWAMNEAFENQLNPDTFDCVIKNESGWSTEKHPVNKNGSVDLGIAQWNSQHVESGFISLECVSTPKCAIKRMIKKIKADKGYGAWFAYDNKCKGMKVYIK